MNKIENNIPQHIDFRRLSYDKVTIKGTVSTSNFERLSLLMHTMSAEASVDVVFSRDESNHFLMHLKTCLEGELVCYRCNQPLPSLINNETDFIGVWSEEQAREYSEYFVPLLINQQTINLYDIIEDELIVAIPIAPTHQSKNCATLLSIEPENGIISNNSKNTQAANNALDHNSIKEISRNYPFLDLEKILRKGKI